MCANAPPFSTVRNIRTAYDDSALLELVGDVGGLLDLDELRRGLLVALRRAVPAKWASLNEVGPDRVVALVTPHLDENRFARFAELAHENPIYQHFVRTQDGRACRFQDVAPREELDATRLLREVYAPLGINYQLAFTLPSESGHLLAVVLYREERDFSDAERDFINRARPFLIQSYRNALAYEESRGQSSPVMEAALVAEGLTTREAQVMRLVALGGSNRDVAGKLGLSDRTVQKHLEHAFRKLDVNTRSEASSRAWELAGARRPMTG